MAQNIQTCKTHELSSKQSRSIVDSDRSNHINLIEMLQTWNNKKWCPLKNCSLTQVLWRLFPDKSQYLKFLPRIQKKNQFSTRIEWRLSLYKYIWIFLRQMWFFAVKCRQCHVYCSSFEQEKTTFHSNLQRTFYSKHSNHKDTILITFRHYSSACKIDDFQTICCVFFSSNISSILFIIFGNSGYLNKWRERKRIKNFIAPLVPNKN